MLEIYPWLTPVWHKWQALSETHLVSGAMLCSAPNGYGVEQMAKIFAHTLACHNSTSEPCGFCHSCTLADAGNHPDIHWVIPEKEGKTITVDQIRRCNQWALESSQLAGKRIIIIAPAEAMNESASNALLKTLESPSEHCVFLLLTNNRNRLLPTIISRCQKWDLAEPDINQTYQWLESQTAKDINFTGIRLSQGAPLKALNFFEQNQYQDFQQLESNFYCLLRDESTDYTNAWKMIKDDVLNRLHWLYIILTDVQKTHFGLEEIGRCSKSHELAEIVSYQAAYNAMLKLIELINQLTHFTGLNSELMFTNWLIEIQEEICS